MSALVIPSNRKEHIENCLNHWMSDAWDHIIIIEDNPQNSFEFNWDNPTKTFKFNWDNPTKTFN